VGNGAPPPDLLLRRRLRREDPGPESETRFAGDTLMGTGAAKILASSWADLAVRSADFSPPNVSVPMSLSSNVERLQPSATIAVSTLAKRLRAEGRDVVDLSAGEPDFDTPEWIAEAGIRAIREGNTRYTPAPGLPELRKAIARSLTERAGRSVPWEGVVVSAGAKQALFNACFSLFGSGEEVMIAAPYWTSYPQIVTLARAEPVFVSGPEERDFRIGPRELDEAVTERTRGLILCSPSNPTGTVYARPELEEVAAWARARNLWLISDEIYRWIHFGDGGEPAPGLAELDAEALGPHVVVDGVSKAFAMTGWRIGFAATDPETASTFAALQSHQTSNPATPSQIAALEAFENEERAREAVTGMTAAFRRRRDRAVALVDELLPDASYVRPRGAFYLFLRVDAFFGGEITDSSAFCTWLLEETGVALVPGSAFGDDRYVRISYATSDEILEEGLRRLAGAVGGRRSGDG